MDNIIEQSFKVNTQIMTFLCWYPPEKKSPLFQVRRYFFYVMLLVVPTVLTLIDIIVEGDYDDKQTIFVAETISFSFKILPFLKNNHRIKNCINYFGQPDFSPKDETQEDVIRPCVEMCQKISKLYLVGCFSAQVMFVLPSLVSKNYELPMKIWLPYDATSGIVVYYSTILYFFAACLYAGSATSLIDPLIGGLAYHSTSQLRILKIQLQNLSPGNIYGDLVKCVRQHEAILCFVNEYEKCFSWTMFSQFSGTTLGICFCCIAVTTVPLASIEAVMYITFFFVVISQVFFYCYFGTLLFEENNTLIMAVYVSRWYEYDVKVRRVLITLMERSKRPMIVTAEKFFDLTLETFSKMIKSSYSLVAVLK
ncbi:odorant receptor 4-like [Zophobas morio]|uniref:odorant receptor 4-like n=1 Tax=Zophobas morio TaxID=2755281 RepID=UPI003083D5BF